MERKDILKNRREIWGGCRPFGLARKLLPERTRATAWRLETPWQWYYTDERSSGRAQGAPLPLREPSVSYRIGSLGAAAKSGENRGTNFLPGGKPGVFLSGNEANR